MARGHFLGEKLWRRRAILIISFQTLLYPSRGACCAVHIICVYVAYDYTPLDRQCKEGDVSPGVVACAAVPSIISVVPWFLKNLSRLAVISTMTRLSLSRMR